MIHIRSATMVHCVAALMHRRPLLPPRVVMCILAQYPNRSRIRLIGNGSIVDKRERERGGNAPLCK